MSGKKDFASFLKSLRAKSEDKGISVEKSAQEQAEQLGKEFGFDQTTLSRYENAKSWPTMPKLLTLARVYGVPIAALFEALGAKPKELCRHKDAEKIDESDLYPPEHTVPHQALERILAEGGEKARGIIINLNTFDSEIKLSKIQGQVPDEVIKAAVEDIEKERAEVEADARKKAV